jgi:small subunit ribosomal protein S8
MSLTDPVADFLARIRNAIRARHQKLDVPASKLKTEIARILKEEGYISNYKTQEEEGKLILRVYLKYGGQEAAIRDLASSRVLAAASTSGATRSSACRVDWVYPL